MIYMLMFAVSTFFAYMASRAKDKGGVIFFSVIAVMIPCIMGGVRAPGVGNDTGTYALPHFWKAMDSANFQSFIYGDSRLSRELGWSLVTYASTKIFGSINANFFIYQLLTIPFVYIGAYRQRKRVPFPFTMLIFFLVYYNQTYNFMRQCIAASIIFMVMPELESRKYKKFFLAVIAASMFHMSALLAMIYFLGFHWLITAHMPGIFKKTMLYGGLLLILLTRYMIMFITRIVPFLSQYSGFERYSDGASYATSGLLFGSFLMFWLYKKGAERLFRDGSMCRFYRYNMLFNMLYRLTVNISATRILFYFSFVNVFLVASIPWLVRNKSMRMFYALCVIIVALIYWYSVYILNVRANGTWPYRSMIFW